MTIRNDLTTSWSTAIGPFTFDCPFQCRKGFVFLSYGASAPADVKNAFYMAPGDVLIVPAGSSVRLRSETVDHEVFYEEFTA